MVQLNDYCSDIIDTIDLESDPRFIEIEKESIKICHVKLVEYLHAFIEMYSKPTENISDEDVTSLNELSVKLLGPNTLGECSYKIMYEALYYIRLFQLSNEHFRALEQTLYTYENGNKWEATLKLNSLIMMNITCYGAGSRPMFRLSHDDELMTKDAVDLEVGILYLIRNMNDINGSLAQPILTSPLDLLYTNYSFSKKIISEKVKEAEPEPESKPDSDSTITFPEMLFIGIIIIICTGVFASYISNKSVLQN